MTKPVSLNEKDIVTLIGCYCPVAEDPTNAKERKENAKHILEGILAKNSKLQETAPRQRIQVLQHLIELNHESAAERLAGLKLVKPSQDTAALIKTIAENGAVTNENQPPYFKNAQHLFFSGGNFMQSFSMVKSAVKQKTILTGSNQLELVSGKPVALSMNDVNIMIGATYGVDTIVNLDLYAPIFYALQTDKATVTNPSREDVLLHLLQQNAQQITENLPTLDRARTYYMGNIPTAAVCAHIINNGAEVIKTRTDHLFKIKTPPIQPFLETGKFLMSRLHSKYTNAQEAKNRRAAIQ